MNSGKEYSREDGSHRLTSVTTETFLQSGDFSPYATVPDYWFKRIAEHSSDGILVLSPEGSVLYASPTYDTQRGYTIGHTVGLTPNDIYEAIHPDDRKRVFDAIYGALNNRGTSLRYRYRAVTADYGYRWYEDHATFEYDRGGEHIQTYVFSRDITEQVTKENELERVAADNAALLQEIHHRVKNNLSVMASLLSLQVESINSRDEAIRALQESRDRIHSIAAIHDEVYVRNGFTTVTMDNFVRVLANQLHDIYLPGRHDIVSIDVVDVELTIERAVPVAIIINELLTNAFRYAFPSGYQEHVTLTMSQSEAETRLVVTDNGIGITEEQTQSPSSVGLNLVRLLAQQIGGTVYINTVFEQHVGAGTSITVVW